MTQKTNENPFNSKRLSRYFQDLSRVKHPVLMLDYDGTLAPFRKERDQAIPYKGVRDILTKLLQANHSRIVIISGRWTKDLIPLLGLKQLPEIWGSHGIERRMPNGDYFISEMPEIGLQALAEAESWIYNNNFGKLSEKKPGCLALHWRGLTHREIADLQNKVMTKWRLIASDKNLLLNEFDGGIELRIPGIHKGHAVKTILQEAGDDSLAAYLGDDRTDEDAFQAIKGKGLGILVREEYRETAAEVWLHPPQQLLDFLHEWHRILNVHK
jgi:trehalose 6-phosphate phosphatase